MDPALLQRAAEAIGIADLPSRNPNSSLVMRCGKGQLCR